MEENKDARPEWVDQYLNYSELKKLIKGAVTEHNANVSGISFSPRTTSLSVQRPNTAVRTKEDDFFASLEAEVRANISTSQNI